MDNIAIKVDHVSKSFKLPHEKATSIKSVLINFRKSRTYEKQEVLKDVSFDIKKGEFFGIVGRNGSGKSTLLKLLAGIYSPTKGDVIVRGKLTPFIELGVGFNQELTGRENVFLNGALLGFTRRQITYMYDDIVKFAELERFMDQRLKNYSSGMQVRLAFSIATRARSDILLIDEVLAVGDVAFQQKCYNYFEELKKQGKTVVFVSHDMSAVRRFCTKAVYIKDGKFICQGTPTEIADIYAEENIEHPGGANTATQSDAHRVDGKITKQTSTTIEYSIEYASQAQDAMQLGISLLRDGISIGEIVTPLAKPLYGRGKVVYRLDIGILNGGTYQLAVALFRLDNREIITFGKSKSDFVVKGSDPARGAAIKLPDTWKYKAA